MTVRADFICLGVWNLCLPLGIQKTKETEIERPIFIEMLFANCESGRVIRNMNTEEVGKKVVELCRKEAWYEALDQLY
jgi:hypothetical protein